jgi:polysaccharide biosynthesis transport protein
MAVSRHKSPQRSIPAPRGMQPFKAGREESLEQPRYHWVPSNQRRSVFLDAARVLYRHKWLFLTIVLCGGAAGYLSTLPRPPVYRARALLDIQPLNENFFTMKTSDTSSTTAPAAINAESFLQTQIKLLQSHSVVDRVTKKLKSQTWDSPEARDQGKPQWANLAAFHFLKPRHVSDEQEVARTAEALKVRAVGATRLVEVLCDGATPHLAMTFCNTLSNEFIESSLEVRADTADRTRQWLTGQLGDLRKNLADSEERLQDYARNANIFQSPDKETIAQERLRNLQNELTRVQAERMEKQSTYELSMTRPVNSLPAAAESPVFREYSMRLTDLQRQRAELVVSLTPDHPRVQKLDAQITEVKAGLQREQDQVLARARSERDSSTKRESLLQAAFSEQFKTVTGQAEKAVAYNMLRREVESQRQLYEVMLQRVREVGFASAMRDSTIRVVDPALLPVEPVSPNVPMSILGGLALGCLFGMGFAFLRDSNDGRIRQPAEVTVQLGVPELGIIPTAGSGVARLLDGRPFGLRHASPPRSTPALLTTTNSMSAVAEAFRATMNSVLFASGGENSSRVIVVTSPGMRDGKTTLSVNLAAALAETGRRVLLVDADMRKPQLHKVIPTDNSFGLHDILASHDPVDRLPINRLASPTQMRGLWLLPSGTEPVNISKLLHSKRLVELIDRLRREFELIVLDTPPLLPVSDARLFGRASDGVLLVVRVNQTTRQDALRARNVLMSDKVPILGTIFNDSKEGTRSSYYQTEERWSAS